MSEYNEYHQLYMSCFPDYPTTPETFRSVLRPDLARIVERRHNGRLLGFALVHPGSIPVLCVDAACRGQGVGSAILAESERLLQALGSTEITIGCGPHYLLQGVPHGPAVDFFRKRGYTAGWTSINMELDLGGFDPGTLHIPPPPPELRFRFAEASDRAAVLRAVEAADSKWVGIFEACAEPILLAELGGRAAGFEILDPEGGYFVSPGERVGSIGCVGVVPDMRQRGIGLAIVAEGARWLKEHKADKVELRYTWLEDWYGRLGFRTVSRQWMGEKKL